MTEVIGHWDTGTGPLYQRLATALSDAIEAGRLAPGDVLPPERQLAEALAVSRSTVVSAFELLKRTGRLEARQGSGTWVRGQSRLPHEGNVRLLSELEDHAILRDLTGAPTQTIDFTAAAVDAAPEVAMATASLDHEEAAHFFTGHGYSPLGSEKLRAAVAERLTSIGVPSDPSQILITSGATQAVLLAGRLYLQPGATALVETPSYAGAIDVLHALGARLMTVDVDASGARTDQLADVLARSLPRAIYVVPDFHNPTGLVMSERRRQDIARLAGEFHVPVIEDIVQRELWFDEPPPPPIASFAPDAPILTVGSLSKVFWGGLRLGWVRASETIITRLARMKAVTDFGTPLIAQLLATRLLPAMDETAAWRREQLAHQLSVLESALAEHVPDWTYERPRGGLSLWAKLPAACADELVRRSNLQGVAVVPGPTFAADHHRHTDRVRLPFAVAPRVIEEGVRRIAAAWSGLDDDGRVFESVVL